jgi:hypothetical protein
MIRKAWTDGFGTGLAANDDPIVFESHSEWC